MISVFTHIPLADRTSVLVAIDRETACLATLVLDVDRDHEVFVPFVVAVTGFRAHVVVVVREAW